MVAAPHLAPLTRPALVAQRCIERLQLTMPVDVMAVARACRVQVLEQPPGGPDADAFLAYHPKQNRWAVFLNPSFRDPRRRRFTIAHELGHYLLHRSRLRGTSLDVPEEWEWEANEFAAHLLIPQWELDVSARLLADVETIQRRFDVSAAAAAVALRRAGLSGWR